MTDWMSLIDRGIAARIENDEPPVFDLDVLSQRIVNVLDENETDQEKLKFMNLCFDALVCLREQAARI
jgi:hypothetical protein